MTDPESESAWARLPVDDVGYLRPELFHGRSDAWVKKWVRRFEATRYGGWRNHGGLWRSTLGLDTTRGRRIIDWGCGFGIEALQYARLGNRITLSDLTREGLAAAERVLAVHGFDCEIAGETLPEADIFYANGSLHHCPEAADVLETAPCPEARLMVYSDRAFAAHGSNLVRAMDEVGSYADWYSPDKLDALAPSWRLRESHYITQNGFYLTAILDRE
jgi:SAM-dependent methyltransferase